VSGKTKEENAVIIKYRKMVMDEDTGRLFRVEETGFQSLTQAIEKAVSDLDQSGVDPMWVSAECSRLPVITYGYHDLLTLREKRKAAMDQQEQLLSKLDRLIDVINKLTNAIALLEA